MNTNELKDLVIETLSDMKAKDVVVLDVHGITSICDIMVIASGTSARHVKSIADAIVEKSKEAQMRPLGVEGEDHADWILADLGDVVVHIMKPEVREFYQLEKLWSVPNIQ